MKFCLVRILLGMLRVNVRGEFFMDFREGDKYFGNILCGMDLFMFLKFFRRSVYMDVYDFVCLLGKFLWRKNLDGDDVFLMGGRFLR